MTKIGIVDYGLGNVGSIFNMFSRLGADPHICTTAADILDAQGLVLPGVGAFDEGMTRLAESGMQEALEEQVNVLKRPILGICLGFQMLTRGSEEGKKPGLGWLDCEVLRFTTVRLPIPNVGWRKVEFVGEHPLSKGLVQDPRFYFVHSYRVIDGKNLLCSSDYDGSFSAGIAKDNIMGVQFHPEKSHRFGKLLLSNFADIVGMQKL